MLAFLNHAFSYFINANTQDGFVTLLPEIYHKLDGYRLYLLSGISDQKILSVIQNIADYANECGFMIEFMPCSFDPVHPEAIRIPQKNLLIMNSNNLFVTPASNNIIEADFSNCINRNLINASTPILQKLKIKEEESFEKTRKNLKAAGILDREIRLIYEDYVKPDKMKRFVKRISEKYFSECHASGHREVLRFLSAITPIGIVVKYETLLSQCDTVIAIEDEYGVVSNRIILYLLAELKKHSLTYIRCPCGFSPTSRTEHIIIPDLRLGLFTSNSFHPMIGKPSKRIHAERFIEEDVLRRNKNKLRFLQKTKTEFIGDALQHLKNAKIYHEIAQTYYTSAESESYIKEIEDNLIEEIFS